MSTWIRQNRIRKEIRNASRKGRWEALKKELHSATGDGLAVGTGDKMELGMRMGERDELKEGRRWDDMRLEGSSGGT